MHYYSHFAEERDEKDLAQSHPAGEEQGLKPRPFTCRVQASNHHSIRGHHEVLGQREGAVVYSADDDEAFLGFDYNGRLLGND